MTFKASLSIHFNLCNYDLKLHYRHSVLFLVWYLNLDQGSIEWLLVDTQFFFYCNCLLNLSSLIDLRPHLSHLSVAKYFVYIGM